jgi:hypothetical protein
VRIEAILVSGGRKQYAIGDGFLIGATSANGGNVNLMGRFFFKSIFLQAQGALTWPGDVVTRVLSRVRKPWLLFNSFVRFSY